MEINIEKDKKEEILEKVEEENEIKDTWESKRDIATEAQVKGRNEERKENKEKKEVTNDKEKRQNQQQQKEIDREQGDKAKKNKCERRNRK